MHRFGRWCAKLLEDMSYFVIPIVEHGFDGARGGEMVSICVDSCSVITGMAIGVLIIFVLKIFQPA